jgi:hypothetical protein
MEKYIVLSHWYQLRCFLLRPSTKCDLIFCMFFCLLFIFIYTYCIHKHTYIIFLAVLGFEFRLVLARQAHYILSHTFNLFYYSHFGDRILLLSAQASLPCDLCFFFFFSFFKAALGPHAC